MRPLDPRLVREVRPARRYVLLTGATGSALGALVVVQAYLLADVIATVFSGADVATRRPQVAALIGCVAARVGLSWVQERYGERAATAVIADLRLRVLAHAVALGPSFLRSAARTEVVTLTTVGLENLRPYLARYLPQLLLAAVVTPALLVVVAVNDPLSAAVIALSLPLVALGRERGPAARVRALGQAHRHATNRTLRTAFLSSLVLELLTTLSVALVAVGVGLRLLSGSLDLRTALVVLILAPEVYLPLRQVGTQFHASSDGLAAVDQAFAVLARPLPASGTLPAPDLRTSTVVLDGVAVQHEGRDRLAPDGASLTLRPGTVTALTGPSGCGKTTLAEVVLGLRRPDAGEVDVVDAAGRRTRLVDVDRASWLDQVAWLGQHPTITPGTVRENVLAFAGPTSDVDLDAAARLSGLADVVAGLPLGWRTPLGAGGVGLSAGQRQRLALTRVLLTDAPLVVLDEPSAHLDAESELVVLDAVRALGRQRRTVLVIAHRPALAALADEVVDLSPVPVGAA